MPEFKYISRENCDHLKRILKKNLRRDLPQLREILQRVIGRHYEYAIYSYYNQSIFVFEHQEITTQIVSALTALAPENQPFCEFFHEIIQAGTGREFQLEDNQHWFERAAPIMQAFLHARYFLEMAVKYGEKPKKPLKVQPHGWAALLCLYGIR